MIRTGWHSRSAVALGLVALVGCQRGTTTRNDAATRAPVASPKAAASSRAAARRTGNLPKQLMDRNRLRSQGLLEWNGAVVSRTTPPLVLDLAGRRADALTLPGCDEVVALASYAGRAVALCKKGEKGAVLLERHGADWKPRAVPASFDPSSRVIALAGDDKELWLLDEHRLHRSSGRSWSDLDVPPIPTKFPGGYRHAVVHAGRLVLGQDRGEWGGALLELDPNAKSWHVEDGFDLPVVDLKLDKKGALWVVSGLSHLGMHEGSLHRQEGEIFTLVASSRAKVGKGAESRGGDWNLSGTSFEAVAFDADNHAYLLTSLLGLVRHDDGGWKRLTPEWNEFVYLAGLEIVGDNAVIASYDAGLVLADLASGKLEEVASR